MHNTSTVCVADGSKNDNHSPQYWCLFDHILFTIVSHYKPTQLISILLLIVYTRRRMNDLCTQCTLNRHSMYATSFKPIILLHLCFILSKLPRASYHTRRSGLIVWVSAVSSVLVCCYEALGVSPPRVSPCGSLLASNYSQHTLVW